MKHFLKNKDIDLRSKVLLYMTGPLNALLWGCESWNLSKKTLTNSTFSITQPSDGYLELKCYKSKKKESKTQQLENFLETYKKSIFILNAAPGPTLEK